MEYQILNGIAEDVDFGAGIIIDEIGDNTSSNLFTYNSLVKLKFEDSILNIYFRFYKKEELSEFDLLFVNESCSLVFRTANQFGIIDIRDRRIVQHKSTFQPGIIERIQNSIIIDDELIVESYSLSGQMIDSKPIDPPTTQEVQKGLIIFNSPCWGVQKLVIE